MGLDTVVINVAYVALFASTFMRTVPRLRGFLVAAAVCFIVFGAIDDNWSMVAWNALTGALNVRQLVVLARARRSMTLNADGDAVRRRWFPDLDAYDFAVLWSMGDDVHLDGDQVIVADRPNEAASLVVDGVVEVRRPGRVVHLGAGSLVGEMSLVAGSPATADVSALGDVTLRRWPHERLEALHQLNPRAAREFDRFVQRDLTSKVLADTERGGPGH